MRKYTDLLIGLMCGIILTILSNLTYNNRYRFIIDFDIISILGALICIIFIILILIKVFKNIIIND